YNVPSWSVLRRRPPIYTLFPYTPLFRSIHNTPHTYHLVDTPDAQQQLAARLGKLTSFCFDTETTSLDALSAELVGISFAYEKGRSEEHTSELQSRENLVCRLLLEKKKMS